MCGCLQDELGHPISMSQNPSVDYESGQNLRFALLFLFQTDFSSLLFSSSLFTSLFSLLSLLSQTASRAASPAMTLCGTMRRATPHPPATPPALPPASLAAPTPPSRFTRCGCWRAARCSCQTLCDRCHCCHCRSRLKPLRCSARCLLCMCMCVCFVFFQISRSFYG